MPSKLYPIGNGTKLCVAIKNAIVNFIVEFETKPKCCYICSKPRYLPKRVEGVPIRTRQNVPKKTILLKA